MIAAVLVVTVTEADRTQRAVTVLVIMLLLVAALLGVLTVWYWRRTDPRRRARDLRLDRGGIDLTTHQMDDLYRSPAFDRQTTADMADPFRGPRSGHLR